MRTSAGTSRLFIFGLGYVGRQVAYEALKQGVWHVSGSCRSPEKAVALRGAGVETFAFDLDDAYTGLEPAGLEALAAATHLLVTVPPVADLDRDPLLALHMQQVLDAPQLQWVGYLSTTSVYGDHAGGWVDERSETRGGARAAPRLRAEQEWLSLRERREVASHVFRLAGIYGPGRSALDTVRNARGAPSAQGREAHPHQGREAAAPAPTPAPTPLSAGPAAVATRLTWPVWSATLADGVGTIGADGVGGERGVGGAAVADGEPPRYVSRIHVADIATVLLASTEAPAPSAAAAIYNVADDEPAPRAEVMAYASHLLELSPAAQPPEGDGERARRRAIESKRVANGRMRALLSRREGRDLAHPSYREGLRAILESESRE